MGTATIVDRDTGYRYVAAARALASVSGSSNFTVRDVIAGAAGSRKSFYASFGSKDDLLCEMFAEDCAIGAQMLAEMVDRHRLPRARLDAWIRGLFELMAAGEAGYVGVLVREHRRLAETRPAEIDSAVAPLVELIPVQEIAAARFVFHLTLATIHDVVVGRIADLDTTLDDLSKFCWSGSRPIKPLPVEKP